MIQLNLAIYKGDTQVINFINKDDLIEYIKELSSFNCIWLVADDNCDHDEIMITESIENIITAIKNDIFDLTSREVRLLFIQEYQTYEDAYAVALSMREENPKCYN